MKPLLALACLVFLSLPASAEVFVVGQFANLETSAASHCQGDPEPEPDFQKHFVDVVVGTNPTLESSMSSLCGIAGSAALLDVTREGREIRGSFASGATLAEEGGCYSSLVASITLRVDQPTPYSLACSGATEETGVPHWGAIEFTFLGGAIHHTSDQATDFQLEWTGVLQPGTDYTLHMAANSERVSRYLPGGPPIGMNGSTMQTVTYSLTLDADIVAATWSSVGSLKSRY